MTQALLVSVAKGRYVADWRIIIIYLTLYYCPYAHTKTVIINLMPIVFFPFASQNQFVITLLHLGHFHISVALIRTLVNAMKYGLLQRGEMVSVNFFRRFQENDANAPFLSSSSAALSRKEYALLLHCRLCISAEV